jgi:hypothetical protein
VFFGDKVADAIEHGLEIFAINAAIAGVQIEYL